MCIILRDIFAKFTQNTLPRIFLPSPALKSMIILNNPQSMMLTVLDFSVIFQCFYDLIHPAIKN